MDDSFGAVVDFSDVISLDDPMVGSALGSILRDRLAAARYREFRLTSRVMVLVFNANDEALVKRSLGQLDRDLASTHHGKVSWKIYDLNADLKGFRADCLSRTDRGATRSGHEELAFRLDADRLGAAMHIVEALLRVDLSTHLRSQPAMRFENGLPKEIEFEEYWVSIDSLAQALGTQLQTDSFRFGLVTELLDLKVLRRILKDWKQGRVSLNFRVRNTLTAQFEATVANIEESQRRQMIFELPVADLYEDRDGFAAASKKLQEFGFQVALDCAIWPTVEAIEKVAPEIQLAKVPWNQAFKHTTAEDRATIRKSMDEFPSKTFVLCRCDDEAACHVGLELGFQVLQGRGVKVPATFAPRHRRSAPREVERERK